MFRAGISNSSGTLFSSCRLEGEIPDISRVERMREATVLLQFEGMS